MGKNHSAQVISRSFLDAVEQFNRYDKKARTFGTDHELFLAEIHLIDFIGRSEDCCISDIAKSLHVTKGAVSQMVKKLERKGYLAKAGDPENRVRVIVQLTQKGGRAFREHCRYHRELDEKISAVLKDYDEGQQLTIERFLRQIQKAWR